MNNDWQSFGFAILALVLLIAVVLGILKRQKPPQEPTLEDRRQADLKASQLELYEALGDAERAQHSISMLTARIARLKHPAEDQQT